MNCPPLKWIKMKSKEGSGLTTFHRVKNTIRESTQAPLSPKFCNVVNLFMSSLAFQGNKAMVYGFVFKTTINSLKKFTGANRLIHTSTPAMIQVGEVLPSLELAEGTPGNKVNILDICKKKKVIIFAVPGAFTPGCSKTHLPGYLLAYDNFKKKEFEEIICISVNDAFVMDAWAKDQKVEGKIRMLADADASFTKAINLHINVPPLGGIRSKRYSMIVEDGIVKSLNVEPDGTGLSCSLAERLSI